jgi:hypothetical protein
MTLKDSVLALSILISIPCFAFIGDDNLVAPMQYAIVPLVGYHGGYSHLSGNPKLSNGFSGGLGFRFLRDGYFFTPNAKITSLVGLDKSPLVMTSYGFVAGGRLPKTNIDFFMGVDDATMIAYKVSSAAMVKAGLDWEIGSSGLELYIDAFYGDFTQLLLFS